MAHFVSKRVRSIYPLLLLLLIIVSCGEDSVISDSVRDYYFDEEGCTGTGLVYVYESVSDPALPPEHWHFRYSPGFRGNYFHAALYSPSGDLVQEAKERIERDFSQLLTLDLYYFNDADSLVGIPVQINSSKVFAFGATDSIATVTSEIEYLDTSVDSVRVVLTRTRELARAGEYAYEGKVIPAITISTYDQLETETEGYTTSRWEGYEIYGQDIGLLYYKKEISESLVLEYELVDRMPFEQFKQQGYGNR